MTFDTIASSPVGTRMLDDLVGDGFAGGRSVADCSEVELYEVATRAAAEVSSEKWSAAPGRLRPWEARVSRADAERLAREVMSSTAARWWSDAFDARPQVWIGRAYATPTARIFSSGLAGKPPSAIWTSSAVAGVPSAWWPVLKNGPDATPPEGPQAIWRLTPHPDARVFEIRTPADWRWLCEAFPGPAVDGWAAPGWEAAKQQFDGVHLTVAGLIRCQGAELETARGLAKLDDWDAESTAWLRWSLVSLERLGTVARSAQRRETTGSALRRAFRRP